MNKQLEKLSITKKFDNEILNLVRGGKFIMDTTRQSSSFQHCTGDCYDTSTATFDDDGFSNGTVCTYANCP